MSPTAPARSPAETTLDRLSIGLSIAMILLGLRQWAIIVGLSGDSAGLQSLSQSWQIATMYLAVVDPIAAVGLWLRSSWGRVVWIVAAVSELLLHSLFVGTFGPNLLLVGFHGIALAGMGVAWIGVRRAKGSG